MNKMETERLYFEQMSANEAMWKILFKDSNIEFGQFKLYPIREDKKRLVIYFFVKENESETGYSHEAMDFIMVYGSGVSGLEEVQAAHFPEHPKAIERLKKQGYQSELEADKDVFTVSEQKYWKGYVILECYSKPEEIEETEESAHEET